jgi:pyrroline-5-carboxylate reductase
MTMWHNTAPMLEGNKTLAVIGCGTMGEAIVRGIFRSGKLAPGQVHATDRRADLVKELAARHKMRVSGDNLQAAREAQVALVCLKPQHMAAALDNEAMRDALADKLVVSIAAGVRLSQLEGWLPRSQVIRAMPNTPAVIGEGMTIIARGRGVSDAQAKVAEEIFCAVGRCTELDESNMDVITALNGSGPAFAYLVLEALADGAVMMGLRRDVAFSVAAQMLQGSARMVLESGLHPAALKDQVTTPAGCTIAGLLTLEDGRIRSVLARAVEEATRVAGRLGQS